MTTTKGTKEWAKSNFNISIGCENDCKYCYAKAMAHRYGRVQRPFWKHMRNKTYAQIVLQIKRLPKPLELNLQNPNNIENPELLDIMFPSSHDITEENLERACYALSKLLEKGYTVLIVTKPRLEVIAELLYRFQRFKSAILFRFTMTSGDDQALQYWETNASLSRERMICLYLAYKAGFSTSVSIEPFLEDYTLIEHIKKIQKYVTQDIWVGPMNFTHVPKEYIQELNQAEYYTKENLIRIKQEIDALGFDNIKYKDHFLNKINGGSK
ncbi:MAG: hypothetical protein GPJ51_08380 [Candidatus Heimdallarchaeota archaeon]|nr:hypothetical protein [Candidatus Heimdallarchaeota archaeon]